MHTRAPTYWWVWYPRVTFSIFEFALPPPCWVHIESAGQPSTTWVGRRDTKQAWARWHALPPAPVPCLCGANMMHPLFHNTHSILLLKTLFSLSEFTMIFDTFSQLCEFSYCICVIVLYLLWCFILQSFIICELSFQKISLKFLLEVLIYNVVK